MACNRPGDMIQSRKVDLCPVPLMALLLPIGVLVGLGGSLRFKPFNTQLLAANYILLLCF